MGKHREIILVMAMIAMIIAVTLMECIDISRDSVSYSEEPYREEQTSIVDTYYATATDAAGENVVPEEEVDAGEQLVQDIIDNMSLEEKVGQIFFIKNDGRFGTEILDDYPVGGIILFAGDMKDKTADELKQDIQDLQDSSTYPLLIGTDEEGGTVNRISLFSQLAESPFKSPRYIYGEGGFDAIYEDALNKSELLLEYGINVNFSPVCDLAGNPGDYMYDRSFGDDAQLTSQYISTVVDAMEEKNIGCVLKHFPGYGSNGDTHKNIVRDERDYETFLNEDFKPFQAGIDEGAGCIMVNHNIVECMDADWPASLSSEVHDILRNELQFDGVIITDDLGMDGVSDYVSDEESAVQAILAGNDMILSTYYDVQYNAVLNAVREGTITEDRINESVERILRWKYHLGLLDE